MDMFSMEARVSRPVCFLLLSGHLRCAMILPMKLSIIVPAYNEEDRIGNMLDAYLPFFSDRYGSDSFEILVVINGTTDRTEEIVRSDMADHPCLDCIIEPQAVGKGGAVMLGFARAKGDLIGFVDADGATPPEAFQDLIDSLGEAGAIIASRWRRDSIVSPRQPLSRRIASRVFNIIVRVMFGLPLTDTQCGAKLFRRDVIVRVLPKLGITRWAFDVDLLYQLKRDGCRVTEIPTTWQDVKGSKLPVGRASTEMMFSLIRLRLMHSPFKGLVRLYRPKFLPFIRFPES